MRLGGGRLDELPFLLGPFFESMASALDSASVSVLSSEALSAYTQGIVKTTAGQSYIDWAETGAEAVVLDKGP